ncbi:DUF427 domain-containing protein [Mycolicibacterium boenickei]|uniref:DUF427 domain-containing protein n=1 Tax=Mycolicibacterium boenickei TaxID=146017 RepID=A0AAX2ZQ61_9MYCO|nr:DUF427 domain-containing protein [Mycolicibacterium boenickei]PEG60918.1 nucleotidyltransferase domain-containing protein [Mycolicibacterium boenickei]UNB97632.1 DUF427 domain-containing protein [Mycolicibacterium boenickei]BBX93352.1 hypothetical protein MBOE_50010 [Mycolicibacterium boenickei]
MSLVAGRGPLSTQPAGWFTPPLAAGTVYIEPHPRRIQAFRGGTALLDTEHALMVHRAGHPLSYAFPADELGDLPHQPVAEAPGYAAVPWDAVDSWFEEGRKLVHYPPNPYHRVDCRPTRRGLRVSAADTVLVDTDETVIVFETALEPRLYVDPVRVRTDLLKPSQTTSYCNYKGTATYWSAVIGDTVFADMAWSYPDTPPESLPIQGLLSFDATRVDVLAELPSSGTSATCGCEL